MLGFVSLVGDKPNADASEAIVAAAGRSPRSTRWIPVANEVLSVSGDALSAVVIVQPGPALG